MKTFKQQNHDVRGRKQNGPIEKSSSQCPLANQEIPSILLEPMEPRLLLTTWNGGDSFTFTDATNKDVIVRLTGNIQMIAYHATYAANQVTLTEFDIADLDVNKDMYCLRILSCDEDARLTIQGEDVYTGSIPSLHTGSTQAGYPITAPTGIGQVYIGVRRAEGSITNIPVFGAQLGAGSDASASALPTSGGLVYAGIYIDNDGGGDPQTMGTILIDGTVTGRVNTEGSIGTFYCGWLLTGNTATAVEDNFNVGGDIGRLWVKSSIGTNLSTISLAPGSFYYNTGVDINVGGKIGTIQAGGAILANISAENAANAPSLEDAGWTQDDTAVTEWITTDDKDHRNAAFAVGHIPLTASNPLANGSASTPTYLGTVTGTTTTVTGELHYGGDITQRTDHYAVGLLAGQTITMQVNNATGYWGIVDPEGRVVAYQSGSSTLRFTATNPGVYRLVVAVGTDYQLDGTTGIPVSGYTYTLNVTGLGDVAVGGIKAGGDIVLGSADTMGLNATRGKIGAIVSGQKIASLASGNSINLENGDLAAMVGATIGVLSGTSISYTPDATVDGKVGLIQATGSFLGTSVFATDNIQRIDAASELAGFYLTNKAIGVIHAGQMTLGTGVTQFSADYDNSGRDGIIDLIDVTGDVGSLLYGGPRITTGTGGNVRFFHIGDSSSIWQDTSFSSADTSVRGGIEHYTTSAQFVDDSGALVTLSASGLPADQKAFTTWTYGIYGTGGVAILRVESDYSLSVTASSSNGGLNQSAEIGEIALAGAGLALTTDSKTNTPTNPSSGSTSNKLTLSGTFRLDVFEVSATGTLNTLTNSTLGDIVNLNAQDVGEIRLKGNLGLTSSTTGALLDQIAVIGNTYPFVKQHNGVVAQDIASIQVDKAIGAINASGGIGTIKANADGVNDQQAFEGLVGSIVMTGSLKSVDIGEGISAMGWGMVPNSGLYVGGTIYAITGKDADIRGDVVSKTKIVDLTLTNGSLVGVDIAVFTDFEDASPYRTTVHFPSDNDFAKTTYEIERITINGNGGIISSYIGAADIGFVTVAAQGFGILNTRFSSLADGIIGGISAGGYGIRSCSANSYSLGYIRATGTGAAGTLTDYSDRVRLSERYTIDPYTGQDIANVWWYDLTEFVAWDGDTTTGVIDNSAFEGNASLTELSAYSITGVSRFNYSNSVNTITVRQDVSNVRILTGTVSKVDIRGDANNFDLEVAGKIGTVTIAGDSDGSTYIYAKGPSSSISSFTSSGNFAGVLTSEGLVNKLVLGTAGNKTQAGTGDFTGTINLFSSQSAKDVTFYGAMNGTLTIQGNVTGKLTFSQGLANASSLIVHGDAKTILIGTDPVLNSGLAGDIQIDGNLSDLTVTGAMANTSQVNVDGNLGKLTITGTAAALLAGDLVVGGTIQTITINGPATAQGGSLTGYIQASKSIQAITVTNGDISGGAVIKSLLGDITTIRINSGILDGEIDALNGTIGTIQLSQNALRTSGDLAGNTLVQARVLMQLTVPGNMTGAVIKTTLLIDRLTVTGSVSNSVISSGSYDNSSDIATGTFGTISVGGQTTNSVMAAGGYIKSFTCNGVMDRSSISSGLVLGAAAITNAANDATPLANASEIQTLLASATLYHGNFDTVNVNRGLANGLTNGSAITAGLSPGADGIFGNADDAAVISATGGRSQFKSVRALPSDASSVILAETSSSRSVNGADIVGVVQNVITPTGNLVAPTSQNGNRYIYTIDGHTLTLNVGNGTTVQVYDNAATAGVVDSVVLSNTTGTALSVTATVDDPNALSIGRLLTGDDTILDSFVFNGDIVGIGDPNVPAIQIDSAMKTLTVRNLATDANWTGYIGGDVGTLTIANQGVGTLAIAGDVKTLKITSSTGTGTDGIMAQSFGSATVGQTGAYTGRLMAIGSGINDGFKSLRIAGTAAFTGVIHSETTIGSLALDSGTASGSIISSDGTIKSLSIKETHAGMIYTGVAAGVTQASFQNVNGGLLVIAGDLTSLRVSGNATNALFSAGTYVGADGLYNNDDDVVYGGSIGSASFSGIYQDSVLSAGVLPRNTGTTGLPTDRRQYTGNATAANVLNVSPAETGGIVRSDIGQVRFSRPVVSSQPLSGVMSVVVAANSIASFTYQGDVTSASLGNSHATATATATQVDTDEIQVVFDQPINTSRINSTTINVTRADNSSLNNLVYAYSTRLAANGQTQYVVTITRVAGLEDAANVVITGGTAGNVLTTRMSLRAAAIIDWNNDAAADHQSITTTSLAV